MKNIPDVIYLQLGFEPKPEDDFETIKVTGEVTWCDDRINDSDIEYARVRRINIEGMDFVIQSYKQNEFVNLCSSVPGFSSIRINFQTDEIETYGKKNKEWEEFVQNLPELEDIDNYISKLF